MINRRSWLKGVAAAFTVTAIPWDLNVVAQNLDVVNELPTTPKLPIAQATELKRIIQQIMPVDIINSINSLPHDPSRYGLSYHNLFTKVQIYPGEVPVFLLDLLTPASMEDFLPSIILNKNQNLVKAYRSKDDYVVLEWSDFIGDTVGLDKKYMHNCRWDILSRWVQEIQYNFQTKVAKKAWECILNAAELRNVVIKTDENWMEGLIRKVCISKTFMRRSFGNNTSLNRGRLADIYVPTQTYEKIKDYLEHNTENTIIDIYDTSSSQLSISNVRINHAPELSWFDDKSDFGIGAELNASDTNIIIIKDEPMVLHKELDNKIDGFAWQDAGMGVLDPRRLVMIE